MNEESTVSDVSWKKLVIAKTNNEWISTAKSKQSVIDHKVSKQKDSYLAYFDPGIYSEMIIKSEVSDDSTLIKSEVSDDSTLIKSEVSDDSTFIKSEVLDDSTLSKELQDQDANTIDVTLKKRKRKGQAVRNETPEERAARLAKMSAYAAQRLANETPEQRALRLKRMSEYAAKRLALETGAERARRLARMSAYAARRLSEETPTQRSARLARMSAYAARRQAMKRFINITPV